MTTLAIVFFSCQTMAATLPSVLSDADAETYAEIFRLQGLEKITAAQKLDATVTDDILMPDVLCDRYLSKTYRTRGVEVSAWMNKNYDLPCAANMVKLAKIKKASVRAAKIPGTVYGAGEPAAASESWTTKKYNAVTESNIKRFKSRLSAGSTKNARAILQDPAFKRALSSADYGRLSGRLAYLYYADGNTDMAATWGEIAASANSEYGLWTIGLMNYSAGDFATAADSFIKLSELEHINAARKTEALFWAARSLENTENVLDSRRLMNAAAEIPQTFYGALAAAATGGTPKYKFFDEKIDSDDVELLLETKYGKIALAALQVNNRAVAEQNLRLLITPSASDKQLHAVHAVASIAELPRVSMQVAGVIRDRGITEIDDNIIFSAQYPMPDWEPLGGWSIDRALLFAITRQESQFKVAARSNKGAAGVMQIMPKTAKIAARSANMKMSELDMQNPEHNMLLGQQHIVDLLGQSYIDNNIIKMLIAYNAGPGALLKFEKNFTADDPLLYIESFPLAETRNYIKRVLANYWLYKARLGQPLSDIAELSAGGWPKYESSDSFVQGQIAARSI